MNRTEKRFSGVARSKTFRHIVDALGLESKSVFDIGCSYGEFLVNFGPESVGLTSTKEKAESGVAHGLDVRYGDIEGKVPVTETFDALFANNLFEHLSAPHLFLLSVKKFGTTYEQNKFRRLLVTPSRPKLDFF